MTFEFRRVCCCRPPCDRSPLPSSRFRRRCPSRPPSVLSDAARPETSYAHIHAPERSTEAGIDDWRPPRPTCRGVRRARGSPWNRTDRETRFYFYFCPFSFFGVTVTARLQTPLTAESASARLRRRTPRMRRQTVSAARRRPRQRRHRRATAPARRPRDARRISVRTNTTAPISARAGPDAAFYAGLQLSVFAGGPELLENLRIDRSSGGSL